MFWILLVILFLFYMFTGIVKNIIMTYLFLKHTKVNVEIKYINEDECCNKKKKLTE